MDDPLRKLLTSQAFCDWEFRCFLVPRSLDLPIWFQYDDRASETVILLWNDSPSISITACNCLRTSPINSFF